MAPVNLGEQSVLAAEVVTHQRPVHASLGGNHADRDTAESTFGKQPLGRSQELFARLGGGPFGRSPFGREARGGGHGRIIQLD